MSPQPGSLEAVVGSGGLGGLSYRSPTGRVALPLSGEWTWSKEVDPGVVSFTSPRLGGLLTLLEGAFDDASVTESREYALEPHPGGVPDPSPVYANGSLSRVASATPPSVVVLQPPDEDPKLLARVRRALGPDFVEQALPLPLPLQAAWREAGLTGCYAQKTHGLGDGLETVSLRWVVSDGRTLLHLRYETHHALQAAELALLEATLEGLRLHPGGHPVVHGFLARLQARTPNATHWRLHPYDPLTLHLCWDQHTLDLGAEPLVRAAERSPEDLARTEETLRGDLALLETLAGLRAPDPKLLLTHVFPLLRIETPVDTWRPAGLPAVRWSQVVREPLGAGWFVYHAVQASGFWWYVSDDDLLRWGLDKSTLAARALKNLAAASRPLVSPVAPGRLLLLEHPQGLAPSSLLLPAWRQRFVRELGPNPHLMPLNAGVLLVVAAECLEAQELLGEEIFEACCSEETAMSRERFVWQADRLCRVT